MATTEIKIAEEILKKVQRGVPNQVTITDLARALMCRPYLGLEMMSWVDYRRLIEECALEFCYPSSYKSCLTWPEFILAKAYAKGVVTAREDITEDQLIIWDTMANVCAIGRGSNKRRFTWEGWVEM